MLQHGPIPLRFKPDSTIRTAFLIIAHGSRDRAKSRPGSGHANFMPLDAMRSLFDVAIKNARLGNMEPLTAIYPKYDAPIVTQEGDGARRLKRSHWGFLTPNKSKKTGKWLKPQAWNNSRDNKIRTSGLWKASFRERRCLVPATAYAEATGRNPATFHWFGLDGADGFAFAGIWMHQQATLGETEVDTLVHSVVTTAATGLAADYHNRMPVILKPDAYDLWLRGSPDDAFELLHAPPPDDLVRFGGGVGVARWPPKSD